MDILCCPSFPDRHLSLCCLVDSKGNHLCHFLHIPRTLGGISGPWHNVALQQSTFLIVAFPKHVEHYSPNHPRKVPREQVMWGFFWKNFLHQLCWCSSQRSRFNMNRRSACSGHFPYIFNFVIRSFGSNRSWHLRGFQNSIQNTTHPPFLRSYYCGCSRC
jgi:hypothetical protein